uniref:transposase n=1 Tax=Ornithobacterium rhinotracheale TaxID=28251 RepID=UPI0039A4F1C2
MNVLEFSGRSPDEERCKKHLSSVIEKEGIVCDKCGCKKHWWLKSKWVWQCSQYNFRTSLRKSSI